uniref:Uncharacterized protein n=1 Tax=Anguilla anguilla TaxID=7936 RepID=A0A0E9VWB7_ANGAN
MHVNKTTTKSVIVKHIYFFIKQQCQLMEV